jgi:hypothetical protein
LQRAVGEGPPPADSARKARRQSLLVDTEIGEGDERKRRAVEDGLRRWLGLDAGALGDRYARATGSETFMKKSLPLSSTRMNAGKSFTSIR